MKYIWKCNNYYVMDTSHNFFLILQNVFFKEFNSYFHIRLLSNYFNNYWRMEVKKIVWNETIQNNSISLLTIW